MRPDSDRRTAGVGQSGLNDSSSENSIGEGGGSHEREGTGVFSREVHPSPTTARDCPADASYGHPGRSVLDDGNGAGGVTLGSSGAPGAATLSRFDRLVDALIETYQADIARLQIDLVLVREERDEARGMVAEDTALLRAAEAQVTALREALRGAHRDLAALALQPQVIDDHAIWGVVARIDAALAAHPAPAEAPTVRFPLILGSEDE